MSSQHIAQQSQLTAESRAKALKSMVNEELDILVVGSRRPDVIRHSALCSSDFPLVYLSH